MKISNKNSYVSYLPLPIDISRGASVIVAGYVCNAFRYELQRSVEKHTTDPLTYARTIIIRYNDEEYVDDMTDFAQAADMSYEDEVLPSR